MKIRNNIHFSLKFSSYLPVNSLLLNYIDCSVDFVWEMTTVHFENHK
jgi:hypothetical protein